jgi:hypothetical protein
MALSAVDWLYDEELTGISADNDHWNTRYQVRSFIQLLCSFSISGDNVKT